MDGELTRSALKRGVMAVLARHPMLRACIRTPEGPHEPLINILGEEREDGAPLFFCEAAYESLDELADRVLVPEEPGISGQDAFDREWQARLEGNLDNARLSVAAGPNWRVETVRLADGEHPRTALVCTMNHALEDQRSSNLMLKGILEAAAGVEMEAAELEGREEPQFDLPPSMEAALVEGEQFRKNTLGYMWDQALAAVAQPRVLPETIPSVEERGEGGDEGPFGVANRKSACEFSSMPKEEVAAMLQACRCVPDLEAWGTRSDGCVHLKSVGRVCSFTALFRLFWFLQFFICMATVMSSSRWLNAPCLTFPRVLLSMATSRHVSCPDTE